MGWTTPRTWATGEVLSGDATATSGFNVQIRDNLKSLRNLNDAGVRVSLSGDQSASNNVYQSVSWQVLDWEVDAANTLLATASGTKFLAPWVGRYELSGAIEWRSVAAGYRGVAWSMTGTTDYHIDTFTPLLSGRTQNEPFGAIVNVTATSQFITVKVFQNSGAALSMRGGTPDRTHAVWRFIGAAT